MVGPGQMQCCFDSVELLCEHQMARHRMCVAGRLTDSICHQLCIKLYVMHTASCALHCAVARKCDLNLGSQQQTGSNEQSMRSA